MIPKGRPHTVLAAVGHQVQQQGCLVAQQAAEKHGDYHCADHLCHDETRRISRTDTGKRIGGGPCHRDSRVGEQGGRSEPVTLQRFIH